MPVQRACGVHPKAPGISLCRHLCSTSQGIKGEGAAGAPGRSVQQHPRHREGSLQQCCLLSAACSLLGQMEREGMASCIYPCRRSRGHSGGGNVLQDELWRWCHPRGLLLPGTHNTVRVCTPVPEETGLQAETPKRSLGSSQAQTWCGTHQTPAWGCWCCSGYQQWGLHGGP